MIRTWLCWHIEQNGFSPSELLMSRRLHTNVSTIRELKILDPKSLRESSQKMSGSRSPLYTWKWNERYRKHLGGKHQRFPSTCTQRERTFVGRPLLMLMELKAGISKCSHFNGRWITSHRETSVLCLEQ